MAMLLPGGQLLTKDIWKGRNYSFQFVTMS
jgi:hypothetical protein